MKLTYVTPTHDPKYLMETFKSLMGQEDPDWRWLVVPNNGATIPVAIREEKRVDVAEGPLVPVDDKIGAIKNFAFSLVPEGIVAELDHDDMLTSDATHKIKQAFEDPEVGFVYSDSVSVNEDMEQRPYNPAYGWTYRKEKIMGTELMVANNAEPSPHSVGLIYFAPNHIRAWRAETYKALGGHDKTLSICDDHDLVCRTYLATKIKHIEECLYIYRIHGENSWLKRCKPIQEETKRICRKYIQSLSLKWTKDNGLEALDLGAAHNKAEGFKGVDLVNADIIRDIEREGLPFLDNTVGVIRANDFLEHMTDPVKVMNEIYRVLAHGGMLITNTPSTEGRGAFQDPTHKSFWNSNSFWYYTKKQYANFVPAIKCRFSMMDIVDYFPSDFHKTHKIPYVSAVMWAIKDGKRYPGLIEI